MCEGCYNAHGRPRIINDRIKMAVELIKKVYDHDWSGGNLHIVLEDWNVEDDNIEYCAKVIADGGYIDPSSGHQCGSPEQLAAEKACCEAFAAMSIEERVSALAIEAGYLKPEK